MFAKCPQNHARMSYKMQTHTRLDIIEYCRNSFIPFPSLAANPCMRTKTCCLTSILSCSFPISLMFLSLFRFSQWKTYLLCVTNFARTAPKTFHQFSPLFSSFVCMCARAVSLPPFYFVLASTCFQLFQTRYSPSVL